jgi:hypothetical protein
MESITSAFEPILFLISVLGFVFLMAIQVFGRWISGAGRLGLILATLILEALVFSLSLSGAGFEEGSPALWISSGILLWVIVAYILFRIRLSQFMSRLPEGGLEFVAIETEGLCTPELRFGRNTVTVGRQIGRVVGGAPVPPGFPITVLVYVFACQPSDSGLNQLAAAIGAEFRGANFVVQFAMAPNRLEMICLETADGNDCEIFVNANGVTDHQQGAVSVNIDNSIQTAGNQAVVRVKMSAALALPGGLAPIVAPLAARANMGTYIWRCRLGPI